MLLHMFVHNNLTYQHAISQRTKEPVYTPMGLLNGVINGGYMEDSSVELSNMLAAANPAQQKMILGQQLYPLVEQLKV